MSHPARVDLTSALPPSITEALAVGRIAAVDVDPEENRREAAEDAAERRQRAQAFRETRWRLRLPSRYAAAALGDLTRTQDPGQRVSKWLDSGHLTLMLVSEVPGVGKTHAAYAVGNTAVASGLWAECWSAIALLNALRPGGTPGTMERATECDVLVLDDLGRETSDRDWVREQIQHIVDTRVAAGRRMVVTSNLATPDAFAERYSAPLLDRLMDDAIIVRVEGESRRRPATW